jgi:hypothetical protein
MISFTFIGEDNRSFPKAEEAAKRCACGSPTQLRIKATHRRVRCKRLLAIVSITALKGNDSV